MKKFVLVASILALLAFAALASAYGANSNKAVGALLLKVNPEISIHYNAEGKVTQLSGENDDGDEILTWYKDFEGKETRVVVTELVEKIKEAGYFVVEVDGGKNVITIELEDGSRLPDDDDDDDDKESSSNTSGSSSTSGIKSSSSDSDDDDDDDSEDD